MMLNQVTLRCPRASVCPEERARLEEAAAALAGLYPGLAVTTGRAPIQALVMEVERWRALDFDPQRLDAEVHARLGEQRGLCLEVVDAGSARRCGEVALEVVTRCHRLHAGRNLAARGPLFDQVLGLHQALHDRRKPLVAADHDHALDTWRWVLRLCPDASLAAQLGGLLHDVERLESESEVRVEQHSSDYQAFKDAHAARGAVRARALLAAAGAGADLTARVADLVRNHEAPWPRRSPEGGAAEGEPEKEDDADAAGDAQERDRRLVGEADALSFFSLNAAGFCDYYGVAHTRRKVAYTLARLGPRGRRELARVRHRADLQSLLQEAQERRREVGRADREARA